VTGLGLNAQFELLAERGDVSEEVAARFCDVIGETCFIASLLQAFRYTWRPSTSSGAQCGEYDLSARVLSAFADVARRRHEAERAKYDE
jgi:hypothetical protein